MYREETRMPCRKHRHDYYQVDQPLCPKHAGLPEIHPRTEGHQGSPPPLMAVWEPWCVVYKLEFFTGCRQTRSCVLSVPNSIIDGKQRQSKQQPCRVTCSRPKMKALIRHQNVGHIIVHLDSTACSCSGAYNPVPRQRNCPWGRRTQTFPSRVRSQATAVAGF